MWLYCCTSYFQWSHLLKTMTYLTTFARWVVFTVVVWCGVKWVLPLLYITQHFTTRNYCIIVVSVVTLLLYYIELIIVYLIQNKPRWWACYIDLQFPAVQFSYNYMRGSLSPHLTIKILVYKEKTKTFSGRALIPNSLSNTNLLRGIMEIKFCFPFPQNLLKGCSKE